MKRFLKLTLPVVMLAMILGMGLDAQAKGKKTTRMVYYIVCGSYSSLDQAIKFCEEMSEVVFYEVFEAKANGKTVYRTCCACYYNIADAKKDLNGIYSSFGNGDWWIWPSRGLAKCVYRPLSPADGETRIPVLKPSTRAFTE
ncbi:MAG: hypothetical protein IJG81_10665 [Muribaculaceae bacterium]|nr:hypothetical protein [Muribaculaceae bacterium]